MTSGMIWVISIAVLSLGMTCACGGSRPAAQAPAASSASPLASRRPAAAAAPVEHPLAKTALEAQSLIQDQVDGRMKVLWGCVSDYRTRIADPHKGVVVEVGIDEQGMLMGVTAPRTKHGGDLDPKLKDCMWKALHGLPFPRSHAGVIELRQTFTDTAVTP